MFVHSGLPLPAQYLCKLWRDRLFPSSSFCVWDKESALIEIQPVKARAEDLPVPHGRVQAKCYKQSAMRIVVGNGGLQ
jgi:hypothetical protein